MMERYLHEYRMRLPLSLDEYQVGQLYGVGEASKDETGGGEGWEWLVNEPFHGVIPGDNTGQQRSGQFTHKVLYLSNKFPNQYRCLTRQNVFEIHEKSWNCYPYVMTEYTNPNYMKGDFRMTIVTMHQKGTNIVENAHNLTENDLKKRTTELLDIVNDFADLRDFKANEDPTVFQSQKQKRGPLKGAYWIHDQPVAITVYKLVTLNLKWRGWEGKIKDLILKVVRRVILKFNRKVYCSLDNWFDLSLDDIRKYEEGLKTELDIKRKQGDMIGTRES